MGPLEIGEFASGVQSRPSFDPFGQSIGDASTCNEPGDGKAADAHFPELSTGVLGRARAIAWYSIFIVGLV